MSPYTVEYRPIHPVDVYCAADILWSEHALVRSSHAEFTQYRNLLLEETLDQPGLVCRYNGRFVGALVIGDIGPDSHYPGTGCVVYYSVVSNSHPQATRLLYRYLVNLVSESGGDWYQTTRRVSESEFHSKYRRIHNGQKDQKGRS